MHDDGGDGHLRIPSFRTIRRWNPMNHCFLR